jgi:hypothetical protein
MLASDGDGDEGEDKMIKSSRETECPSGHRPFYTEAFFQDTGLFNILNYCRQQATDKLQI